MAMLKVACRYVRIWEGNFLPIDLISRHQRDEAGPTSVSFSTSNSYELPQCHSAIALNTIICVAHSRCFHSWSDKLHNRFLFCFLVTSHVLVIQMSFTQIG